jgi:hypothetical protein
MVRTTTQPFWWIRMATESRQLSMRQWANLWNSTRSSNP